MSLQSDAKRCEFTTMVITDAEGWNFTAKVAGKSLNHLFLWKNCVVDVWIDKKKKKKKNTKNLVMA
ncbi:hypothetical protein DY000_02015837 [Brassica cretica]|uniref:Uncharacterized protein n=1 Tax=Brassica cretica TaxID=69181 RepID=A0ABQ7CML9_BRACR|nr:hypothetical protein DY000_02015837 [Brassica cretica]